MAESAAAGPRLPPALGAWLGLLAWGAIALAASLLTPLWADDWCRVGLAAWSEVFERIGHEYTLWSGRIAQSVIASVLLGPLRLPGLPVFPVLNALAFVALAAGLCTLASWGAAPTGFAGRLALALSAGLLLWWVPSSIAETALWKTGSIAYLWAVAAAVLILTQVAALLQGRRFGAARLSLLALATGFSATFLEPLSAAMGGALAAAAGWAWWRGRAGWRALLVLLAAHAVGTIALVVAPGNFVRLGTLAPAAPADWAEAWFWLLRSLLDRYAAGLLLLVLATWLVATALTSPAGGRLRAWRSGAAGLLPRALPFALFAACYLLVLLPLPAASLSSRVGFPVSVALCGIALAALSDAIARLEALPAPRVALPAMAAILGLLLVPAATATALRDVSWTAAMQRDFPPIPRQRPAEPRDVVITIPKPPEAPPTRFLAIKSRFLLLPGPDAYAWAGGCFAEAIGVRAFHVR